MNLNYEDSNRFLGMLAEVAAQTLNYEENNLFKQLNDTKHKKVLNEFECYKKALLKHLLSNFINCFLFSVE